MYKTLLALMFLFSTSVFSQLIKPPKKLLTKKDCDNLTINESWLLKNSIYAKYGKPFENYELNAFFMKQKWYKANDNYNESKIKKMDIENINTLEEREGELNNLKIVNKNNEKFINLSTVYNLFQYPAFASEDQDLLKKNGFIVYPSDQTQLYHIYEDNDYKGIPSFVSVDAVLQMYHMYFDQTLKRIESVYLTNTLDTLLTFVINELESQKLNYSNDTIKNAIDFDLAVLGVSHYLLKGDSTFIKGRYRDIAFKEIQNCLEHEGFKYSELFKKNYDYSQYIVRGHYTRSLQLKRYFYAMMWIGNVGISLQNIDNSGLSILSSTIPDKVIRRNQIGSLILSNVLSTTSVNGKSLISYWGDIYEPTVFYVGVSDDVGPFELNELMDSLYTGKLKYEEYLDTHKIATLLTKLEEKSNGSIGKIGYQELQFRFMGQRFIPDSYIFQRLTNIDRPMPNSLDIMAGFGNEKAKSLMLTTYLPEWTDYKKELDSIIIENAKLNEEDWTKNLYYSWIYNLKALFDIKNNEDIPFFMQTEGWKTKTLNTCLASWSELRHNTILYAKQSMVVECGGGESETFKKWIPEPPKGYVEPNIEFYSRLKNLMERNINELEKRGLIDLELINNGNEFIGLLTFLHDVSVKELKNETISLQEYEQIQKIGSLLEDLTESITSLGSYENEFNEMSETENDEDYGYTNVNEPDKNMPVIADVHTANDSALEVGVGNAHEIYVLVEIEGKLKLTRGAIFSFYEFPHPINDRLTDEKWQNILKQGKEPPQPEWINYKSKKTKGPDIIPLYKPEFGPSSTTEPGWHNVSYDTGC